MFKKSSIVPMTDWPLKRTSHGIMQVVPDLLVLQISGFPGVRGVSHVPQAPHLLGMLAFSQALSVQ